MLNRSARISFHTEDLLTNDVSGQLVTVFTLFDVIMVYVIMSYLAWSKDRKANTERQPTFLPKRPPFGFRLYAVLLETGQSPAGGTTSQVFLRMCGKLTTSPAFTLTCTNEQGRWGRRLFASQNKDLFILALPHYLGGIEAFEVVTDRSGECPPWFLRSIRALCLDNGKCWKSNIGAWLRGDKKPYRIKADVIGALSTKDYLNKVMRLNHLWLFPWYRSLGSSFTSLQRWSVHWTSICLGLGCAHYFLYDDAILNNLSSQEVDHPHFNANQVTVAGFAGAALSVVAGSFLRFVARIGSDLILWPRVDDKDDFSHMFQGLEFAFGAVVCTPQEDYAQCMAQLKLTPKQIRHLRHITECQISGCNLKTQLDKPKCSKHVDCCYATGDESPSNGEAVDKTNQNSSSDSLPPTPMQAHKRGFKATVERMRKDVMSSSSLEEDSGGDEDRQKQGIGAIIRRIWGRDSSGGDEGRNQQSQDIIPTVSARVVSGSESLTSVESTRCMTCCHEADGYDSLSEGESDQEMATRCAKTDSEINLSRRPAYIYDIAPKWDDNHKVWVQSSEGGDEHHRLMGGRYECASGATECCLRRLPPPTQQGAIERYLAEEEDQPDGVVTGRCLMFSPFLCLLGVICGFGAVGYTGYQRWYLPNADTLIYLYAVLLIAAVQPVLSTADAFFWAMIACWHRRSKILSAREMNARMLYAEQIESVTNTVPSMVPSVVPSMVPSVQPKGSV